MQNSRSLKLVDMKSFIKIFNLNSIHGRHEKIMFQKDSSPFTGQKWRQAFFQNLTAWLIHSSLFPHTLDSSFLSQSGLQPFLDWLLGVILRPCIRKPSKTIAGID